MGSYTKVIPKFVGVLALIMVVVSHNAQASQEEARKFVETVSHDALAIITSGDNAVTKETKLSKLFMASVDTKWIARFTMGKYWRDATQQQKDRCVKAYQKFLLGNYVPKFNKYTNQEIKIVKVESENESKNEYLVETQILSKDSATINVDYKIHKSENGKWMIYDMVAEGVSLISTQRSDFASVLSRGGVDELIKMLKERS